MAEDNHDTAEIATKYLLIIFNFLFLLVGVALLAVGIVVIVQTNQIDILEILDNPLIRNGAYLIIGLGSFIIVVSVVGYVGMCRGRDKKRGPWIGLIVKRRVLGTGFGTTNVCENGGPWNGSPACDCVFIPMERAYVHATSPAARPPGALAQMRWSDSAMRPLFIKFAAHCSRSIRLERRNEKYAKLWSEFLSSFFLYKKKMLCFGAAFFVLFFSQDKNAMP
nr:uncharacterized protein LOC129268138 [Lytechinus pictus]XP_054761697.1 uncharacterized protein LOC129268138 [Lytechinus pictus]